MSTQSSTQGGEVQRVVEHEDVEHALIEEDGKPVECVIFPQEGDVASLMTEWVSAEPGSYVSLEDAR